jgi:hypothetical protein
MNNPLLHHPYSDARNTVGLALMIWGLAVVLSSAEGVLARFPAPVFAAIVVAAVAMAVTAVLVDLRIRAWLGTWDMRLFTAFNAWRVAAGLAFLYAGAHGSLPMSFAVIAGSGDVLVGVIAAAIIAAGAGPRAHFALHVLGLADFVAAVGTGIFLTLAGAPLMGNIASFPIVLIALLGVPLTAAAHAAALATLRDRVPSYVRAVTPRAGIAPQRSRAAI